MKNPALSRFIDCFEFIDTEQNRITRERMNLEAEVVEAITGYYMDNWTPEGVDGSPVLRLKDGAFVYILRDSTDMTLDKSNTLIMDDCRNMYFIPMDRPEHPIPMSDVYISTLCEVADILGLESTGRRRMMFCDHVRSDVESLYSLWKKEGVLSAVNSSRAKELWDQIQESGEAGTYGTDLIEKLSEMGIDRLGK